MKVLIVGAGPAGLYLAYLLRRHLREADVTIVEQNRPDSTFGFGLVFSERALEFLHEDDSETHDLITPAMKIWRDMTICHRGQRVRIDGIGFAGIGRLPLLELLQRRLLSEGLTPRYEHLLSSPSELEGYDLAVGADGANSFVRRCYAERLGTTVHHLNNKFAWYGTTQEFDTLTQTFVETEFGPFNAHHYSYAPGMSTFLVECAPDTWERAGFAQMGETETLACCAEIFREALGGKALVSNRSIWRNFPVISNERWHLGNVVLVGDALRTAHFSIGSGTRLAMEDVIALSRALRDHLHDIPSALDSYEAARRPIVEKLVHAANASAQWYEDFPAHMALEPLELAMSYIQRSGRIDLERLRKLSPRFVDAYERAR